MSHLLIAAITFSLAASNCTTMFGQQLPKSTLTIIGADVSSSLTPEELLDSSHVRSACMSVEASGKGGMVAFDVIGNPSGRKLLRCSIQPNPPVNRTLPPTRRKEAEKRWKEIRQKNIEAINAFVDSCHRRMQVPLQSQTDLNGFFEKAGRLCREPQFKDYQTLVFTNTDGHHDMTKKVNGKTIRDTTLQCILPSGVKLWASSWKNSKTCNLEYTFESPGGFTDFFQQHINNSK